MRLRAWGSERHCGAAEAFETTYEAALQRVGQTSHVLLSVLRLKLHPAWMRGKPAGLDVAFDLVAGTVNGQGSGFIPG